MITLIGTSTTVIGFGLCGIDHIVEIGRDTQADTVQRIVDEADTPIIMVEERYVSALTTDRIIIPIPDRYTEPEDRMAQLVRDVIGSKGDTSWE